MNVEDIRNVTFDRSMRGYRAEQVDKFLTQVAGEFERMEREKEDIEKKLYILAEKVDQYRNDEETLKTALLNAQRMGESVIYEARQKAETIVYDANTKASRVKDEAAQTVADAEAELHRIKMEVTKFKKSMLDLYRQHIELISAIPEEHHIDVSEEAEQASAETAQPAEQTQPEPAPETPEEEELLPPEDIDADTFFDDDGQDDGFVLEEGGYLPDDEGEFAAFPEPEEEPEPEEKPAPKPRRRSSKAKKEKPAEDSMFGDYQDITYH